MRLDIDSSAHTLLLPNGPELLEGRRAVDAGLVGTGRLQDVVCAAVGGDGALFLRSRARVVRAIGFDDVVLNQRVACPAVERDIAVDVGGVPGARVGDIADTAGVPALAGDEVANVGPLYIVLVLC
jgi:hypothetical protein